MCKVWLAGDMTNSEPVATTCPVCGYQTLVESHGAPGGSDWRCGVCDLREENRLLRESRERIAENIGSKQEAT